jgi:hypothetical protein
MTAGRILLELLRKQGAPQRRNIQLGVADSRREFDGRFREFSAAERNPVLPKIIRDSSSEFQNLGGRGVIEAARKGYGNFVQCGIGSYDDHLSLGILSFQSESLLRPVVMAFRLKKVLLRQLARGFFLRLGP